MKVSAECMHCLVKRQADNIKKYPDEEKKAEYLGKVLGIIANNAAEEPAPVLLSHIGRLHEEYFGKPFSFEELKKGYNAMLLGKETEIRTKILEAADPLALALRFSQIGNFIDFGAMDSVDDAKLMEFLEQAETLPLSEDTYAKFTENLKTAKKLVYMTDNCGEVVTDKLFIKELQKSFPKLKITVIVRGAPTLNDATLEDAEQVGLPKVATVLSNGTNIAGTCIEKLSDGARNALLSADLTVSKGQGNFETLHDCGLNVYYLFLCKCSLFSERFNVPKLTGMFLNDRRMK